MRMFDVDVLPRRGQYHLAVRRMFGKAECYRLLVHQREFTYNTFMWGRFAASTNAEQCTNIPYILPRLSSAYVIRIRVPFACRCKPGFTLLAVLLYQTLEFKPIPERTILDSCVSDQRRNFDST